MKMKRFLTFAIRADRSAMPEIVTKDAARAHYAARKAVRSVKYAAAGDGTRALVMDDGSYVMLCYMTRKQLAAW